MLSVLTLAFVLGADPTIDEKAEAEKSEEIRVDELKAHVFRLASREFLGRRGPGATRAANHIAAAFEALKIKPLFGESYFQPIPWLVRKEGQEASFVGKNVGAIIPGADPKLKDEWILLSCHLDHLGTNGKTYFPGADDNATGCAMLLEVAERFVMQKEKPRRTIVLVAFDQEETGLQGSTHFCANSPLPIKQLKTFLTADMIGRSMGNVMDEYVFCLGSESSADLRKLIEDNAPKGELKVGRVGTDMIGTRSDYGPFRDRKVPFLFFSTGQHPDYHTPRDTPDRIDYAKLGRICNWIHDLSTRLANAEQAPTWARDGLGPDLEEVRTIRTLLTRVLEKPAQFEINDSQKKLVAGTVDKLAAILVRGRYTTLERTTLLWTARVLMATLF